MLGLIILTPVFIAFGFGISVSLIALYFIGRMEPRRVKSGLACFLGIALGVFVWLVLVSFIPVGEVSAQSFEGYPALLRSSFLLGLTPVAALPALFLYGPGRNR